MKRFDIGVDGVSELIAQAHSMAALSSWFESTEERTFVVKLADYYMYMLKHGTNSQNGNYEINKKAYCVLSDLIKGKCMLDDENVDEIITSSFCPLMVTVGSLLVKQGALLCDSNIGYKQFNIEIAIPKILIEHIGSCMYDSIQSIDNTHSFAMLYKLNDFQYLANNDHIIDMVFKRKDYSYKKILATEFTQYENIVKSGMSYIIMGKSLIKGKVVCEL